MHSTFLKKTAAALAASFLATALSLAAPYETGQRVRILARTFFGKLIE